MPNHHATFRFLGDSEALSIGCWGRRTTPFCFARALPRRPLAASFRASSPSTSQRFALLGISVGGVTDSRDIAASISFAACHSVVEDIQQDNDRFRSFQYGELGRE